jgi:hypothetical protein
LAVDRVVGKLEKGQNRYLAHSLPTIWKRLTLALLPLQERGQAYLSRFSALQAILTSFFYRHCGNARQQEVQVPIWL